MAALRITRLVPSSFKCIKTSELCKKNVLLSRIQGLKRSFIFWNGLPQASYFSTSFKCQNLMDFFDDPKNFGAQEVKVGRAWTKDDLRIKSNSDLHKLWFVLLREYNMLLTMEYAAKKECELFPNPERLDKVRDSMTNLEKVVQERNQAYFELETGETGSRPSENRNDGFGRPYRYRKSEHIIPEKFNSSFRLSHHFYGAGKDVVHFNHKLNEKKMLHKNWVRKVQYRQALAILKRFPDVDVEFLVEKFPDVNIDAMVKSIGDVKLENLK